MKALQEIKRMEEMLAEGTWTNTPWRWQDAELLLRAFRVMREIAIRAQEGIDRIPGKTLIAANDIDLEFEEAMSLPPSDKGAE